MWIIFEHGCFNLDNAIGVTIEGESIVVHAMNGTKVYVATYTDKDELRRVYTAITKSIISGDKFFTGG